MEEPPACKPTQAERFHALRQQARAGDPVAQAQVDALNARNRASAARAKAAGRDYWSHERGAQRWAEKKAAAVLTPEQVERARLRQDRRAAAQRKREAAAARPPQPVLSAEEFADRRRANCRTGYQVFKQRLAAGDPAAIARYEQRLAKKRQQNAAKAAALTPEQRRELNRAIVLKRQEKRTAANAARRTPEQRGESARQGAFKQWGNRAAPTE